MSGTWVMMARRDSVNGTSLTNSVQVHPFCIYRYIYSYIYIFIYTYIYIYIYIYMLLYISIIHYDRFVFCTLAWGRGGIP